MTSPGRAAGPGRRTSTSQPHVTTCGIVSTPRRLTPPRPASSATVTRRIRARRSAGGRASRGGCRAASCRTTSSVIQLTSFSPTPPSAGWRGGRWSPASAEERPGNTGTCSSSTCPRSYSRPARTTRERGSRAWRRRSARAFPSWIDGRWRAHSEDQGSRKLGNRVSPPSTKIVWPVMYAASSLARKQATRAHLVRRARAPHRDVALNLLALDRVVDPGPVDRRDRRARADAVHPDAAARRTRARACA